MRKPPPGSSRHRAGEPAEDNDDAPATFEVESALASSCGGGAHGFVDISDSAVGTSEPRLAVVVCNGSLPSVLVTLDVGNAQPVAELAVPRLRSASAGRDPVHRVVVTSAQHHLNLVLDARITVTIGAFTQVFGTSAAWAECLCRSEVGTSLHNAVRCPAGNRTGVRLPDMNHRRST
jgi:hypothetical protein